MCGQPLLLLPLAHYFVTKIMAAYEGVVQEAREHANMLTKKTVNQFSWMYSFILPTQNKTNFVTQIPPFQ